MSRCVLHIYRKVYAYIIQFICPTRCIYMYVMCSMYIYMYVMCSMYIYMYVAAMHMHVNNLNNQPPC